MDAGGRMDGRSECRTHFAFALAHARAGRNRAKYDYEALLLMDFHCKIIRGAGA